MTRISSTSNPRIKNILKLSRSRERKENGLFVIEGYREISRAGKGGFSFENILFCPDYTGDEQIELMKDFPPDMLIEVSSNVFSRIAYRDKTDGIIAVARQMNRKTEDIPVSGNPLFLVAENIEKPGNIGALLRTADAAGVDAVLVCDSQTDIYNPNVVRSSLGCLFTLPVIECSSEEAIVFFRNHDIRIFAAALQDSEEYYKSDFSAPSAIILGSEAKGLSRKFREAADSIVRIPMHGVADSLNVSVSAAVLIYEALRQRQVTGNV